MSGVHYTFTCNPRRRLSHGIMPTCVIKQLCKSYICHIHRKPLEEIRCVSISWPLTNINYRYRQNPFVSAPCTAATDALVCRGLTLTVWMAPPPLSSRRISMALFAVMVTDSWSRRQAATGRGVRTQDYTLTLTLTLTFTLTFSLTLTLQINIFLLNPERPNPP